MATSPKREVLIREVADGMQALIAEHDGRYFNNRNTRYVNMAVVLRAAGAPDVTFELLDVLSGFATAFAYHPKVGGVMYQPPDHPDETFRRIGRAVGIGWEWLPKAESSEQAWSTLTSTLDSGFALLGTWLDDYVFSGYRGAARKDRRKVCVAGGWDPPGWWTWEKWARWAAEWGGLGRPTGPVPRTPAREMALEVLAGIVRYAECDGRAGIPWVPPDARFGLAGVEAYAADIADTALPPEHWDAGWRGCHCIYRQIIGRPAAAAYLRQAAPLFEGAAAQAAACAADEYDAAWSEWTIWSRELGQDAATDPERNLEVWSDPERRARAAAAVRRAAQHEAAAVEHLKRPFAPAGQ